MKNKKTVTAKKQLTKRLSSLLFLLLLVGNLFFVGISFFFVREFMEERAENIIEAVSEADQSNWQTLLNAHATTDDEDAVAVTLADGTSYYSEDGEEIFAELAAGKKFILIPQLVTTEDGFYYQLNAQYSQFDIFVAINAESIMEITLQLVWLNLLLNIFAVIIGAVLIYFIVGKWSQKLSQLATEVNQLEVADETAYVTEIKEPVEMHQVAKAFNQMLSRQRRAMAREKQFVTDASHELRTPIAAIRGHINLISRRGKEHPEIVEKSLRFIDKESKRLEILSNQLLSLGRSGQQENQRAVNLSQLVLEEIEKIQGLTPQPITYQIAPDLVGEFVKNDWVQIVQNLLENAVKYSQQQGEIAVSLQSVEGDFIFTVTDSGIGIPPEAKERIFERFYRADDSRSSEIEGSGIGLSIVASLVAKYYGTITVTDHSPQGSIFTVKIKKLK